MKKGQNGSSWTSEQSLMLGGNVHNTLPSSSTSSSLPSSSQVTSIDGVSFSEGDLLLQVDLRTYCCTSQESILQQEDAVEL